MQPARDLSAEQQQKERLLETRKEKKPEPKGVKVVLFGHEMKKGMRVFDHKSKGSFKVTAVRPNGKVTLVCKATGQKVVKHGEVQRP